MIRVVLDTNILISALLTPDGLPAQVLSLCVTDREFQIVLSADIYAEYEEVIRRPKFKRSDLEINAILRSVRGSAAWIRPSATVRVCLDPDDDIFLECAQAGDVDYLVTGNTKHFPAVWGRTQVVTARRFIDALA
ncbi:MAG TPA: putative toxin-antitoxin system toxin component, PIN family [Candidatus Binataceae bacterium]|nr:putative toxin-antitoxin system toxin component, PIN family [Candidatus Binataceae bacterium]